MRVTCDTAFRLLKNILSDETLNTRNTHQLQAALWKLALFAATADCPKVGDVFPVQHLNKLSLQGKQKRTLRHFLALSS